MIEVGSICEIHSYIGTNSFWNGCIVKVIRIDTVLVLVSTHEIFKESPIGRQLTPSIEHLRLLIPPKPHEYSPVLMTGRYKTIGD